MGTSSRCGPSNREGTSDWSGSSATTVPSGVPGAPSALTAQFVYGDGRRGIQVSWAPPQDLGGEPVQGYRLLLNDAEIASGGGDFLGTFIDGGPNEQVRVSVIAENSRGRGPATPSVLVTRFTTPSAVTGLVGDRSGRRPAGVLGSRRFARQPDRALRLPVGRRWLGQCRCRHLGYHRPLEQRPAYQVEVRACNAAAGFGEDCAVRSAEWTSETGRPFGDLAPIRSVTARAVAALGSVGHGELGIPGWQRPAPSPKPHGEHFGRRLGRCGCRDLDGQRSGSTSPSP